MKTLLAVLATVLIIAPAGYAIGTAKDPRVPALQRRVTALESRVRALQQTSDAFTSQYARQQIDQRVFAFCQSFANTGRNIRAQLDAEPALKYLINQIFSVNTLACR